MQSQLASAAEGDERYTLSVPYSLANTALAFDPNILTKPLSAWLKVEVTHDSKNGYERLIAGPFQTKKEAVASFSVVKAILAQLAVIHRFPLFFEKNLSELRTTPDFITFDDRPIHGFACLAFPVIIPEHEYVIDDGTLIAQRRPQINLNRLENSFQEIPPRMPEDKKFELAFNAYVAAFATNNLPLTCLSLVTMLEVFMKEIRRSDTEIAALDLISNTISRDENLKKSDASKEILQVVLSSIGGRKNMGKEASLIALIDQHLPTIRALSGAEAFSEARPVAKAILKMRNAITHDAVFQNDEATYLTVQQLMNISQAVLLDRLEFELKTVS